MQQCSGNGVEAGAVRDVGAGVTEHGDHAVRDRAPLAGQVVSETVSRFHKWREHDRLVRQLHGAEHLLTNKGILK